MHAIISVIDADHYDRVEALWRELEADCGLAGIRATPIPHFSWHIAQEYDFAQLQKVLEWITHTARPFSIHTTGLGLFTREKPVIYLPIVRTARLSEIHAVIWDRVIGLSENPSPYYTPEVWMPHITLAYGDVSPASLCCALAKLAFRIQNWEILIDNLAVVQQIDSQAGGLKYRLQFAG